MKRFSRAVEKSIFDRDNGVCQICGRKTEFDDGEIDHIISKSRGGEDKPENLQWSCHRCNKIKGKNLSNKDVRKLLSLPENFDEINSQNEKRTTKLVSRKKSRTNLKHSKNILLTRRDFQGLENWDATTRIENLIMHSNDKLETICLMQHLETGYKEEFWEPLMDYKKLIEKYNYPIVPYTPRFQDYSVGFGQTILDDYERIPIDDREKLKKLKEHLLEVTEKLIFGVKNGIPLRGTCEFCH